MIFKGPCATVSLPLILSPLSARPTKWSNTLKTILSVYDHFVRLALKGLRY